MNASGILTAVKGLLGGKQPKHNEGPTKCFCDDGIFPEANPCGRIFPSDGTLLFTAGKRAMLDSIKFDIVPGLALAPCGVTVEFLKKAHVTVASANPWPPTDSEGEE